MYYKNTSYFVKTFHGVAFKPNETKEVGEYINDPFMVLVEAPKIKPETIQQKKLSSDKIKKEVPAEEAKTELAAEPAKVEEPKVETVKQSAKPSNKEQKS